jgi:Skp family chaperone for outer membrane proteins
MFLLISASTTQAGNITIAPKEQTIAMISAGTVLQHSKHLLHNTTIGEGIKSSREQRAKELYKMAHELFLKASEAHESGQEDKAKELAHKSIRTFYAADLAHHGLPGSY